jgi:MFS transporter, MHS family, citrate/tricarballylate:H+ symporter
MDDVRTSAVPLKRMVAISLGNALEFYDFMIFSFFAVQIGHTFAPAQFAARGLLLALATFGVGFLMRPLGAIVIGRYGDAHGRKPAMLWSFSLMGLSILGTALTPSFARIGMVAPILLLCFRLLQGFALGGEVGPITAYAAEAAPNGHRARYVSMRWQPARASRCCAPAWSAICWRGGCRLRIWIHMAGASRSCWAY